MEEKQEEEEDKEEEDEEEGKWVIGLAILFRRPALANSPPRWLETVEKGSSKIHEKKRNANIFDSNPYSGISALQKSMTEKGAVGNEPFIRNCKNHKSR